MEKQEYLMQLSILQQEAEKIEEQNTLISQQIIELRKLQENLIDLDKTAETNILAPMGKGIFFKAELKEKELFVNIGNGIVIKKTPTATSELIEKQILNLDDLKTQLQTQMNTINEVLTEIVTKAQNEEQEHDHSHEGHNHDHSHHHHKEE